jgi:hypothetical protein
MPPAADQRKQRGEEAVVCTMGSDITGSHDRKVRLGETRLDGARDHVVIPIFHNWMLRTPSRHFRRRESVAKVRGAHSVTLFARAGRIETSTGATSRHQDGTGRR